jgi:hypothetical protein
MRATSVTKAVSQPGALDKVDSAIVSKVVDHLGTIQRVQALASTPQAAATLLNAGIVSAQQVSSMSSNKFTSALQDVLVGGKAEAAQIHDHAMKTSLRNQQALMQIHQTVKGTGLQVIDGKKTLQDRKATFQKVASANDVNISLEVLFGSIDFCDCSDCSSIASPAAYYVDILQYLRNNDLDNITKDPNTGQPKFPNAGTSGYGGTAVERLFKRRPDLQCLELT